MNGSNLRAVVPLHKDFVKDNIPYFSKMFSDGSTWQESSQNKTGVSTVQYEFDGSLDILVEYFRSIYHRQINLCRDTVLKTFQIADYFCDAECINSCVNFVNRNINEELLAPAWQCSEKFEASVTSCKNRNVRQFCFKGPWKFKMSMATQLTRPRFDGFLEAYISNSALQDALGWQLIIEIKHAWYLEHEKTLDNMVFDTDWSVLPKDSRHDFFKHSVNHLDPLKVKDAYEHIVENKLKPNYY